MSVSSKKKLSEFSATAICGNDITSSCLYVSALSISYAGQYAWITLLMVSAVLFLYRKIYAEAVGALPLNGGAYNILLNTTSKTNASIAACLTILSYMATAVISASEAMKYLSSIITTLPVMGATIALLVFFLVLSISGISESAKVASAIFAFHLTSLSILIFSIAWYLVSNGVSILAENFQIPVHGSVLSALFFGFSAAMLGISGFESSANFVEEQKHGVFPKTLRNMWIAVTVINPVIAILAISAIPMAQVDANKESLLAYLGNQTGGNWLAWIISLDAFLVLSGAVLTSFIGVSGLMKRMTLDRILPQFLLKENKRGSSPAILIIFFVLCISILLVTAGELDAMAGVYTISFLSVMAYFAIGNLLLKIKRSRLPRPEYATTFTVFAGLFGVLAALYGNIRLHPDYLVVFLQYFIPAVLLIYALIHRKEILELLLSVIKSTFEEMSRFTFTNHLRIKNILTRLHSQEFVFFSKGDDISILNKVMIYVQENEITNKIKIVTLLEHGQKVPGKFVSDLKVLDRIYPEIDIEFVTLVESFSPQLINKLSVQWKIPKNFMFIGSPGDHFPYKISELGGVRLIM
ncbi:MAG: APC family permease [Spirochaetia bacterium]|nr:APC family permease [Spirochaetia bacterium]